MVRWYWVILGQIVPQYFSLFGLECDFSGTLFWGKPYWFLLAFLIAFVGGVGVILHPPVWAKVPTRGHPTYASCIILHHA